MSTRSARVVSLAALAVAALSSAPAHADTDCQANFTQGHLSVVSLFASTSISFSSHATIRGVSAADAFTRAYREIIKDGWSVVQSDREVGAISATATGNGGKNHLALDFLIEPQGDSLDLTVKITSSAGGMGHPEKHVCGPIEAAAGNPVEGPGR